MLAFASVIEDSLRPFLSTVWPGSNDYINACCVDVWLSHFHLYTLNKIIMNFIYYVIQYIFIFLTFPELPRGEFHDSDPVPSTKHCGRFLEVGL